MLAPPFSRRRRGGRLNPRQDFLEAAPGGLLGLEFGEEFALGGHERAGAADDESDRVIAVALVGEKRDT